MNKAEIDETKLIKMFEKASKEYFACEVDDPEYKKYEGEYVMMGIVLLELDIYTKMDIDNNKRVMCKLYGRKL